MCGDPDTILTMPRLPGPYCIALVELHPPSTDSLEGKARHAFSTTLMSSKRALKSPAANSLSSLNAISPSSSSSTVSLSSSSSSSSSTRGKLVNYQMKDWRSIHAREDAWVVKRLVLQTCRWANPLACASMVESLSGTLVTHRALIASNQIRDGVDVASSFGHTAAADAAAVAAAAATMDAAVRSGIPRATEYAARQATTLPIHGVIQGSAIVDAPDEALSTNFARINIGRNRHNDEFLDVEGNFHRATYSIFLGGALAVICLDSQFNANPFLSVRLVNYCVSTVRTCLACVRGVSEKKTSLRQRIDKKRDELSMLLQRILLMRQHSVHLAPCSHASYMSLTGNTPLLHRSYGPRIPSSSLTLPLSNDLVADFASDIWQEHREDAGPSRWYGTKFDISQNQYTSAAARFISAESIRANRTAKDSYLKDPESEKSVSHAKTETKGEEKSNRARPKHVIENESAVRSRTVNTRGARAESTMWGQASSSVLDVMSASANVRSADRVDTDSLQSKQVDDTMFVMDQKNGASVNEIDNWFGENNAQSQPDKHDDKFDANNSNSPFDMSSDFGNFDGFDMNEHQGNLEQSSSALQTSPGHDMKNGKIASQRGGKSHVSSYKQNLSSNVIGKKEALGRSLSPVREDEEGDEDDIQLGPPKIFPSRVITPKGRTRNSVVGKISTREERSVIATESRKPPKSPRRFSAMPSPRSSFNTAKAGSSSRGGSSKSEKTRMSGDILLNTDVMTLLSEELFVTLVDSKIKKISTRGKLEIRAKARDDADQASLKKDINVRGAFLLHLKSRCPLVSLKHDKHYIREKSEKLPKTASASSLRDSYKAHHSYQCLIPAHPSRKHAIKVLQYVTESHQSFILPMVQHIKASPSIMVDNNKGIHRVALRIKLTSNPALQNNSSLSSVVILAKFPKMPR